MRENVRRRLAVEAHALNAHWNKQFMFRKIRQACRQCSKRGLKARIEKRGMPVVIGQFMQYFFGYAYLRQCFTFASRYCCHSLEARPVLDPGVGE